MGWAESRREERSRETPHSQTEFVTALRYNVFSRAIDRGFFHGIDRCNHRKAVP